jgi:hypothetical protein
MSWENILSEETLAWLLEPDPVGVRFLTMRDLLDCPADDGDRLAAEEDAYLRGPIFNILAEMAPEGYWEQPGAGYYPKYRGSVWSLLTLAQLGASVHKDARIARACNYIMDHSFTSGGQFTISGAPSTTVDCLQGNLCWALLELDHTDPRLDKAFEWMARSVTGEGVAPASDRKAPVRYYAGKCGPGFACGANNKLPCAWGAVKVMLAFSKLPEENRSALVKGAIDQGLDFLFSRDPAQADYPTGWSAKPSGNWWKYGFPVFYVTDLLQNLEVLVAFGYSKDPRLENALRLICEKRDDQGRWSLEYSYQGKTWVDFGKKKQPNKWVTLRALRLLKAAGEENTLRTDM